MNYIDLQLKSQILEGKLMYILRFWSKKKLIELIEKKRNWDNKNISILTKNNNVSITSKYKSLTNNYDDISDVKENIINIKEEISLKMDLLESAIYDSESIHKGNIPISKKIKIFLGLRSYNEFKSWSIVDKLSYLGFFITIFSILIPASFFLRGCYLDYKYDYKRVKENFHVLLVKKQNKELLNKLQEIKTKKDLSDVYNYYYGTLIKKGIVLDHKGFMHYFNNMKSDYELIKRACIRIGDSKKALYFLRSIEQVDNPFYYFLLSQDSSSFEETLKNYKNFKLKYKNFGYDFDSYEEIHQMKNGQNLLVSNPLITKEIMITDFFYTIQLAIKSSNEKLKKEKKIFINRYFLLSSKRNDMKIFMSGLFFIRPNINEIDKKINSLR